MPSASLAVARRPHPDMVRVAALSAAITLNLAALLFATRPLAPQLAQVIDNVRVETVRLIDPPPKQQPLPPDIVVKPFVKHVPVPVHIPVVQKELPPPAVTTPPTTEPSTNSKPVDTAPPVVAPPSIAPGVTSLAYRASPLHFPAQAIRSHMEGTVHLLVLVDASGKPVDVKVEQSSGYPLLDKSAREQVLSSWQFQPAVIDGHAVKAWARVPVSFALQQL
ncbi:energy transducer TonB [Dyella acidiphila]|uniref:Energy transducer TonB n=1 Tax=Dyella acidiphila TaxID=2775866 RepID=A0ABR9G4W3_9GAMM|nr:energy transducer TonB [Dyella acidiphila]MBE1159070.1 energy transducer TonB [Dyella acidiphila]